MSAELVRIGGEPIATGAEQVADKKYVVIADEATAAAHATALRVTHASGRRRSASAPRRRSPAPPFTTSTLQQEASRKLSFNPKRTMRIAQDLYEGIDTPRAASA